MSFVGLGVVFFEVVVVHQGLLEGGFVQLGVDGLEEVGSSRLTVSCHLR